MTAEIYDKVYTLIERTARKAYQAGNTKKYEAAKNRLRDFENRYAEEFSEQEESDWNGGLDPAFSSWEEVNRMFI